MNIQANTESKVVQAIRPVSVVTGLNQEPSLPATVTVEYDKGFPKVHKVTWQAVAKEDLAKYHSFDVLGKVEGIENEAHAKVSVEGIIAVEEVTTTLQFQKLLNYQKVSVLTTQRPSIFS